MSPATAPIVARLAELVGPGQVVSDPAALSAYEVDGHQPNAALRPTSATEVAEIIRFAAAERLALIPMGGRTKLRIGMPPRKYDLALDLSAMNRVLAYDPHDLTLGVEPGVRFADLQRQLAERHQFLPLAPAFAGRATLGGMIAAGADTPLRYGYGTARDCLLGVEFVTGDGVASKSGGRVVKNVTGYDLHKLLIGSLGTLAVITRLNFRTFPQPPERQILVASYKEPKAALDLCAAMAKSPLRPQMLDVVGPRAALLFEEVTAARIPTECWSVVVEVAGHHPVIERHARELDRLARETNAAEFTALDQSQGAALFTAIQEFPRLVTENIPGAAIFRTPALPSDILSALQRAWTAAGRDDLHVATVIRASGVVYTSLLPATNDVPASAILSACRVLMDAGLAAGARPMIEWCPQEVKLAMSVWPPPGSEQAIAERLKKVFDPQGVLSPGRFQEGL